DPAGQGDPDALGDLGTSSQVGAGKDDQELLASPAAGQIDVAHGLLEELGELAEDGVTGRVAEAVVDVLEPVQVGNHDREWAAETLEASEFRGEDLLALSAIREPRQTVDERLPLDDPVQSGVVEGDNRLRSERPRRHPVF